jgi:hypothetical protein
MVNHVEDMSDEIFHKNPNRRVYWAKSAQSVCKPTISEEEYNAEYTPDVTQCDIIRQNDEVRRICSSLNICPDGPAPGQSEDDWVNALQKVEEQVLSRHQRPRRSEPYPCTPVSGNPEPLKKEATAEGISLMLVEKLRISCPQECQAGEEPENEETCFSPFVNLRNYPSWGSGEHEDEELFYNVPEDDIITEYGTPIEDPTFYVTPSGSCSSHESYIAR